MEKLCLIRDVYRSIRDFEIVFQQKHNLCLNEGMALCSLKTKRLSSSDLASALGLSHSNTSKVIKSVEAKGFVERSLGEEDKRQMYFVLSRQGVKKLEEIKAEETNILPLLEQIKHYLL